MNVLAELSRRFSAALNALPGGQPGAGKGAELPDEVRPSQDARFGDYQVNSAMALGKRLSRPPRDVAAQIVAAAEIADICHPPEIAGPGFINLRLRDDWIERQLAAMSTSPRLNVEPVRQPRTYIIDYSSPNVAKPMHVGHIRSTVIGDSLYRMLKFLGHRVVSDNHIGDWGTQFGMILFGYRHFRDEAAYRDNPVSELARLYRLVNRLAAYHASRTRVAELLKELVQHEEALKQHAASAAGGDAKAEKKAARTLDRLQAALQRSQSELAELKAQQARIEKDPHLSELAAKHPDIGSDVLSETARLHQGDPETVRLWREFMPACLAEIEQLYRRLGVSFDQTLGESFYHDRLAGVADDLASKGIARESDGALCIFFDQSAAPMIVRKRDGAFLYATSDLATIQYRMQTWNPDAILYVVDHRQSEHFRQLFAAARQWGYTGVELVHVSFGTVLGDNGRPFKTRSGDTVGLAALLDEAVTRAEQVVAGNDESNLLAPAERRRIAEVVGIAALKYADLSQNRTSDYVFSYDKMLAMNGNTATYMQYAYARVRSIFRRGSIDAEVLRREATIRLVHPAERALGLALLRFSESLDLTVADYRPNQLTNYLYTLANVYSTFFEQCPVLKAPDEATRSSRLLLCDLTARTLKQGLDLLSIGVVEKM